MYIYIYIYICSADIYNGNVADMTDEEQVDECISKYVVPKIAMSYTSLEFVAFQEHIGELAIHNSDNLLRNGRIGRNADSYNISNGKDKTLQGIPWEVFYLHQKYKRMPAQINRVYLNQHFRSTSGKKKFPKFTSSNM